MLKSLTRAEYSPQADRPLRAGQRAILPLHQPDPALCRSDDPPPAGCIFRGGAAAGKPRRTRSQRRSGDVPTYDDLVELGKHLSFTERRAEDAERELRQVKMLELLCKSTSAKISPASSPASPTSASSCRLTIYLIDGLIRYEDLMDDWWDVDERAGSSAATTGRASASAMSSKPASSKSMSRAAS